MFKRFSLFLVDVIIVFSASGLLAESTSRWQEPDQQQTKYEADKINGRTTKELDRELELTLEEQSKIKETLFNAARDSRKILEDARRNVKELKIKVDDHVLTILTAEQRKKFLWTGKARKKQEIAAKAE